MIKFIKYYALEIYTVISILVLVIAGIIGDLSVIQKFVLIYIFLFILPSGAAKVEQKIDIEKANGQKKIHPFTLLIIN